MKKLVFSLIACLSLSFALFAQDSGEPLDLERAIQLGLEQNFDIKIALNTIDIADLDVKIGVGTFLMPSIIANYTKTFARENVEQQFVTTPEPNVIRGAETSIENFNIVGIFGIDPSSLVTVRRLGRLAELSELDAKVTVENAVAAISTAYYRLVLELQRSKVLEKTLDFSKARLQIAEARYELGGAGKRDFLTAQVDYNADLSLVVNQELVIQNARVNLNELLALAPNKDFTVRDTITVAEPLLLEELLEDAYLENKFFLIAQRQENVAYLQIREAQAARLPTFNLNGNYTQNTLESDAGFLLKNQRDGFTGGGGVALNLFSGFTVNRRIQQAKVEQRNAELFTKQIELQVISDIHRAYNSYVNNRNLLEIERANYEVAVENADIALERFRLGIANYLEFRDAQVNLLTAEDRLITSIFNIKEQEIELRRLSGKIFFQNSFEKFRNN
ncbi:MAG: TolC family protein [Nitritalea sp.]